LYRDSDSGRGVIFLHSFPRRHSLIHVGHRAREMNHPEISHIDEKPGQLTDGDGPCANMNSVSPQGSSAQQAKPPKAYGDKAAALLLALKPLPYETRSKDRLTTIALPSTADTPRLHRHMGFVPSRAEVAVRRARGRPVDRLSCAAAHWVPHVAENRRQHPFRH
jgi:hypothetical protein